MSNYAYMVEIKKSGAGATWQPITMDLLTSKRLTLKQAAHIAECELWSELDRPRSFCKYRARVLRFDKGDGVTVVGLVTPSKTDKACRKWVECKVETDRHGLMRF